MRGRVTETWRVSAFLLAQIESISGGLVVNIVGNGDLSEMARRYRMRFIIPIRNSSNNVVRNRSINQSERNIRRTLYYFEINKTN